MYPKVSVMVITYNQIKFIRETIESVLQQDYPNFEIIIADDGSTDGTAEVILEYAQKYSEIIIPLVGGPNLGITGNSNRGLKACKGKYIAFMGGDDLFLPGKLSRQVEVMEQYDNIVICYHNLNVFNSDTGVIINKFSDIAEPRRGNVVNLIKHGCFMGATSVLVRASKVPGKGFDERLPLASDWLFWIDCMKYGGEIYYLDEVLGK
jgi:glycosyltransferase involved in cell wall biosynthesis